MPPNSTSNNNNSSILPLIVSAEEEDSSSYYYSSSSLSNNRIRKSTTTKKRRRRRNTTRCILLVLMISLALFYCINLVFFFVHTTPIPIPTTNNDEKWVLYRSIRERVTIHSSEHDICTTNHLFSFTKIQEEDSMCSSRIVYSHPEQQQHTNNSNQKNDHPLHCVSAVDVNIDAIGSSTIQLLSMDQSWNTSGLNIILQRVDWPWAVSLILILLISYATKKGGNVIQSNTERLIIVTLYLMAVILYKKLQDSNNGWISPSNFESNTTIPFATTIMDSYYAFTIVHPLDSTLLILSHIGTYWFQLAAWYSAKTPRRILLWYLMYEVITSFCNEYLHNNTQDLDQATTRCTRVSYVHDMKQYAVDDMIRAYLLPPFFVYLYLMPKFIYQNIYSILAHFMSMK